MTSVINDEVDSVVNSYTNHTEITNEISNHTVTEQRDEKQSMAESIGIVPVPNHTEIGIVREVIFLALICFTQLLTQSSLAQTVVTADYIADQLGVGDKPGEKSWFAAAFSLTVGTFILVSGRLGDMYGYKKLYIIAYCVISISCLLLGFAAYIKSPVYFDIFRSMQGLGFSIAFPNALALIGHYYPMGMKRILFMCLFGAVAPGGFAVATPLIGLLTERAWWPWTFWILSIMTFAMAVIAFFVIPKHIGNHNGGDFDFLGAITGVSGLILINFAFNQGPNVGWDIPYNYVLLIVGILLIGAFLYVERRVKHPLLPREVMKGETGMILACIAAGWSSFGVWVVYTMRFLTELDQQNYYVTSARLSPVVLMGFVAAGSTAFLIQKIPISVIMVISMTAFMVGNILNGTRPVGQIYWGQQFFSFILTPFGMDMSFPAATIILSHTLPKHQQGLAASIVATFVNYSISIGLGFAGTVEYYTTKGKPDDLATLELGIRNAFRMGMGLAGFGVVVAIVFLIYEHLKGKRIVPETGTVEQEV